MRSKFILMTAAALTGLLSYAVPGQAHPGHDNSQMDQGNYSSSTSGQAMPASGQMMQDVQNQEMPNQMPDRMPAQNQMMDMQGQGMSAQSQMMQDMQGQGMPGHMMHNMPGHMMPNMPDQGMPGQTPAQSQMMQETQGQGMPGHGQGHMMHDMQVSSEKDYLIQMIPHHLEAIDSARIMLKRSDRPEMRQFALEIIRIQTTEVNKIIGWLRAWYPDQPISTNYQPMMGDLNQLEGDALDRAFLEGMVVHHEGAVMMSQQVLDQNLVKHEPLRPFAQNIAYGQQQEIQQMQAWLRNWFGASARVQY